MPIDTSIYRLQRPVEFSLFDLGDTLARRQQLQGGQIALDAAQRQQAEAAALRQAYAQQYGPQAGQAPTGLASLAPQMASGGALQEQQLRGAPTAAFPNAAAPTAPAAPQGLASLAPQMTQGAPPSQDPAQQQAFIRQLYTISPKAGRDAELHQLTVQEKQFDQHLERVKYLTQVSRGVLAGNSQQAHDVGRQMLLQAGMPAADLPAVYDPELWRMYATMGEDSAMRLEHAKLQVEQLKALREVSKAPDYGYGDELNALIYAQNPQLQPGQPPTPAMVTRARQSKLSEGVQGKAAASAATTAGRLTGEEAYREGRPASEYYKDKVANLIDVTTGRPIDPSRDYKDVLAAQRRGEVRQLPQRQAERLQVVQEAIPIVQQLQEYVEEIYGPGGELATANPNSVARLLKGSLQPRQMQEEFPLLTEAARFVDTNAGGLARSLKGEVGAMSEGDVERALAGLPNFRSTFSLGLGLGVAFTRGGIGPTVSGRPSLKTADTARVARGVLQATIDTLNRVSGGILGKRNFQYEELAWPVYPRREAAPGGAPAQSTTMSERDVTEAMRQTGRTRQEVLEAARAKGYTVPAQ